MRTKTALLLSMFTLLVANNKIIAQNTQTRFLMKKETYSDEVMNQLKATTTVFFLKKAKPAELEPFKKAISEVWTITPIIFADISKFAQYAANPKYSYIAIEGSSYSESGVTVSTHLYLALRLSNMTSAKDRDNNLGLFRLELFPSFQTSEMVKKSGRNDDIIGSLYNEGIFFNWSPTLLKAKLGAAQAYLKNNMRPYLFESKKDETFSKAIANDTLYVPEDILISFIGSIGMFTTAKEKPITENLFAKYKYKYRICSSAELYQIFEVEKRGRLLLEFIRSSTDKFVNVYDVTTNKVLYKDYTPLSGNLKVKDIDSLE